MLGHASPRRDPPAPKRASSNSLRTSTRRPSAGRLASGGEDGTIKLWPKDARARVAGTIGAVGVDVEGPRGALDDLLRDHHFFDPLEARQIEHRVEQDALHNRAQPPRPGLALDRHLRDGRERLL